MQVDLDRLRRWLRTIVHTPFHRKALLAATGVTAVAAVAAGTASDPAAAADAGVPGRAAAMQTVDLSGAPAGAAEAGTTPAKADRATKIMVARIKAEEAKAAKAASTADAGTTPGKADRATKIRHARAKAEEAKAAKAAKTKAGRAQAAMAAQGTNGLRGNEAAANRAARGETPSINELMPNGVPGGQQSFTPSQEQVRNAGEIVYTGKKLNLPKRAYVIAVATALQESKLQNLGHLGDQNDHDSLGLFQQRPSSGWGTPEQITNPQYAAEQFYKGLERVPGYQDMPLTQAAQTVQVSAFPDAYAQWEKMAAEIVQANYGAGPYADLAAADK